MIPSQLLQFPFVSGVEEGVDPKTVKPGTLKSLKNYCWTKDGLLEKRNGTVAIDTDISPSGAITSAQRLCVHQDQLCLVSDDAFYTLSDRVGWIYGGRVPEVGLTWETTTSTHADGIQSADMGVTSDGLRVIAYVKGDPTRADYASTATGQLLIQVKEPNGQVNIVEGPADATHCRVLINGTDWIVVFAEAAGDVKIIDEAGTITPIANDGRFAPFDYVRFDACMTADASGEFLLVYEEDTVPSLVIYRFTFAGVAVDLDTVDISGTYSAVSVGTSTEGNVFVVWGRAGTSGYAVHDEATLTQTLAPVAVLASAGLSVTSVASIRFSATTAIIMTCAKTTAPASAYVSGVVSTTEFDIFGGTIAEHGTTHHARAVTKPFLFNGKFYMFMCDYGQVGGMTDDAANGRTRLFPGNNTYLAEMLAENDEPHLYVGLMDLTVGGCFTRGSLSVASVVDVENVETVLPFVFQAPPMAFIWAQGLRLAKVTVGASAPRDLLRGLNLGPELYMAGAVFSAFDSRRVFDFGFPRTTPIDVAESAASAGGGALVAGDYRYQMVPVFPSAAGIKHRGPASPVVKYTAVLNGKVTLVWMSKSLAWKGPPTTVSLTNQFKAYSEIYRTEVGIEVEHKLTMEPTENISFTETLVDTKADANIAGAIAVKLGERPGIYTVAEYDDYAPPASVTGHIHKDRLFVISGDLRTLWYSKNFNEDQTVAPGFNPTAVLSFEEPLTALGSCDEKLIIFSAGNLWYMTGDGPAVSGDGADYSPIQIQTDVGCTNARSVVEVPSGLMFQCERGLYLLTRGLELQWIGKRIQDTLAAYPVITSAVLIPSLNHVRFTCNNEDGDEGVVLNFDHERGQWSVFEYTDGVALQTPIADAIVFNDAWHFVTPGGQVYQETEANSLDDEEWVYGSLETAEVYGDGPLAYHRTRRAYLLGDKTTPCDATIQIAVDAASGFDQTRQWADPDLADGDIGVHIRRQKSQSIRVKWSDAPPTGGAAVGEGRGLRFSALGFEIAPKQGLEKRPAAQRK